MGGGDSGRGSIATKYVAIKHLNCISRNLGGQFRAVFKGIC